MDGESRLAEADIKFNVTKPWSTSGSGTAYDIESVAVHEAGHRVGLGHGCCLPEVMYAGISLGEIRRALGSGDGRGAQLLYPLGQKFNGWQNWWDSVDLGLGGYSADSVVHAETGLFNSGNLADVAAMYDYGTITCNGVQKSKTVWHAWLSDGGKFNYQGSGGWWDSSANCGGYTATRVRHAVAGDWNNDGATDGWPV